MEVSYKALLAGAIVIMVVAYSLTFMLRGRITGKYRSFKTKMDMAGDSSQVWVGEKNRHENLKLREEVEEETRPLLEAEEARMKRGEQTYPQHTTKEEWIKKEYKVGEEKETIYPEHHQKKED